MSHGSKSSALPEGKEVLVREAPPGDAARLIDYLNRAGGETDFLTLGAGEFELSEAEEAEFLRKCEADTGQIYFVAIYESQIVETLHCAAGRGRQMRHSCTELIHRSPGREQGGNGE